MERERRNQERTTKEKIERLTDNYREYREYNGKRRRKAKKVVSTQGNSKLRH